MTANEAGRFHVLKMGLCDDLFGQASHDINPSTRVIKHMRDEWLKNEHGGLNNLFMEESIRKHGADNPDVTILQLFPSFVLKQQALLHWQCCLHLPKMKQH